MREIPLEGKVAGIINARELAVNIGSAHGVDEGMRFKVLADKPTEVHDPESGELIGVVDREKVRVKVVEVQEKLSICKTYRKHTIGNIPFRSMFEEQREVYETFRADESSYLPPIRESESYVKIGDRVLQILEPGE